MVIQSLSMLSLVYAVTINDMVNKNLFDTTVQVPTNTPWPVLIYQNIRYIHKWQEDIYVNDKIAFAYLDFSAFLDSDVCLV